MKKIALAMENFSRYGGGAESYAVSLAETLIGNSWEVHFYGLQWDGEPKEAVFHKIDVPRFLPAGARIVAFALKHRRAVKRIPFDVVLGFGNTISMNVYQSHGGVHWLSTERKLYVIGHPFLRALKRLLTRLSLKHRARHWVESAPFRSSARPKIVAISDMIREDMASYFHVDRSQIEVVYNGVDTDRYNAALRDTRRGPLRRQFGIGDEEVVFLIVSYDLRKKGIEPLVDAAGLLMESGDRNFRIIVVGERPYRRLSRKIETLGLGRAVFFTGRVTRTDEYYANADVFVLPTYYDACSLVVFEAMACGLPVITTEYNGAAGILRDGVDGYVLSHPPRPEELAGTMRLMLSEQRRREMSLAASRNIEEYTIARNHQQMMRIFDEASKPLLF
ncbi:MAG: glycosyltransferase family 4 protein [Deltaproteobacteria bacterium]|nr:glycosyltransferase family 4 protein [Deltaproteobacteria bacterium]